MSPTDDQHRSFRRFAWAGLWLEVPEALRPFRIDGRYRRGNVGLADERQPRLELAWTWPKKHRFDPQRMLRHQLTRVLPRDQRAAADKLITNINSDHFAPLLRYTDKQRQLDRCAGYARGTGRVIELIVHFRNSGHSDEALLQRTVRTLRDQRTDAPQRWAFFGHRITAPAGFLYDLAQLNIGDMSVRLRHCDRPWASITVRLLYTADLALQRAGMAKWTTAFHKDDSFTGKNIYDLPGKNRGARGDTIQTTLGQALHCQSRLRLPVRLIRWRMPARQQHWMIHDKNHDRLVYIRIGDKPERIQPLFNEILDGLDWTEDQLTSDNESQNTNEPS